eukprot:4448914-Pleurochrysis_carterae.AAC.2
MRFTYVLRKGKQTEKLWKLHEHEQFAPKPGGKALRRAHPWKRGIGCARLQLSGTAGRRGELACTLAMVCGNIIIGFIEPRRHKAMPTVTFKFSVMSMDSNGHVIWPTNFQERTRAYQRKQAWALLSKLMADPLYPPDRRRVRNGVDADIQQASAAAWTIRADGFAPCVGFSPSRPPSPPSSTILSPPTATTTSRLP